MIDDDRELGGYWCRAPAAETVRRYPFSGFGSITELKPLRPTTNKSNLSWDEVDMAKTKTVALNVVFILSYQHANQWFRGWISTQLLVSFSPTRLKSV